MTEAEKRAIEEQLERASRKKKRRWPLLLLLLLLLLAGGIALTVWFFLPRETEGDRLERELAAELGLLPGMTEEEIQDRLNRVVADSMMNISINPTPVFENGRAAGDLRIENIPGNSCSFAVTIRRSDTGQTILQTGVIDPGYYVERIALDTPLPAGEYPCLALFTAYRTETLEEIGQAGTTILLTVRS